MNDVLDLKDEVIEQVSTEHSISYHHNANFKLVIDRILQSSSIDCRDVIRILLGGLSAANEDAATLRGQLLRVMLDTPSTPLLGNKE